MLCRRGFYRQGGKDQQEVPFVHPCSSDHTEVADALQTTVSKGQGKESLWDSCAQCTDVCSRQSFVLFLILRGFLRALFLTHGRFSRFQEFTGTPNRAETPRAEISVAYVGLG